MARNRILHLADLHVGAQPPESLRTTFPQLAERLAAGRNRFWDRLACWLESPECPVGMVLVAGDLFDHHSPPADVAEPVMHALARICARGIPVVTVPGNHDEYSYPKAIYRQRQWPGRLVTNWAVEEVLYVDPGELFSRPIRVFSACFRVGHNSPGQFVDLPQAPQDSFNILLLHGTVADPGLLSSELVESERCFRISLGEAAARGFHYIALGHIHRFKQWTFPGAVAVYPGPPIGPSPNDPGSGQLVLVSEADTEPGDNQIPRATVHQLAPPEVLDCRWTVLKFEVTPLDGPEDLLARIRPRVPQDQETVLAAMVVGQTGSPNFIADCQNLLIQEGLPVLLLAEEVQTIPSLDVELLAREQSLLGEWIRRWQDWQQRENPDPQFAQLVLWEALRSFRYRGS